MKADSNDTGVVVFFKKIHDILLYLFAVNYMCKIKIYSQCHAVVVHTPTTLLDHQLGVHRSDIKIDY